MKPSICGRCGAVVVEGGAAVAVAGSSLYPTAPIPLCGDCRDLLIDWLGPRAYLASRSVGPRKAVIDHGRFQTR